MLAENPTLRAKEKENETAAGRGGRGGRGGGRGAKFSGRGHGRGGRG